MGRVSQIRPAVNRHDCATPVECFHSFVIFGKNECKVHCPSVKIRKPLVLEINVQHARTLSIVAAIARFELGD
jgi:hypothetical protein